MSQTPLTQMLAIQGNFLTLADYNTRGVVVFFLPSISLLWYQIPGMQLSEISLKHLFFYF